MAERLDIRLSEEEKKRLAELARQKNVSMTDLVRMWITRGDMVHILAEQLQDFVKDFDTWHLSGNTNTSISFLCRFLQGRVTQIPDPSKHEITHEWIELFLQSFQLLRNDVLALKQRLNRFIIQKQPKKKFVLVDLIAEFTEIVTLYYNIFVQSFIKIIQKMDEKTKKDVGETYNDYFRTRYNEITSKYEDFLKRTQRELGADLERTISRVKEFRAEK